jgi:hypothetical protein
MTAADVQAAGPGGACAAFGGRRYDTPTGLPCPRLVRTDGTVVGDGPCGGCGHCLGVQGEAWPDDRRPPATR